MDLGTRRLIMVLLSVALGVASLFALFAILNLAFDARVTWARYGTGYAVLTIIPLSVFFGIWLDKVMGTGLLPDGTTANQEEAEAE